MIKSSHHKKIVFTRFLGKEHVHIIKILLNKDISEFVSSYLAIPIKIISLKRLKTEIQNEDQEQCNPKKIAKSISYWKCWITTSKYFQYLIARVLPQIIFSSRNETLVNDENHIFYVEQRKMSYQLLLKISIQQSNITITFFVTPVVPQRRKHTVVSKIISNLMIKENVYYH
ncbi:hypothetical protein RCL_jg2315.t1 [Rhizophagus clarus]|uniref:Uncharacterized protein n=1 Tax=Rhizophagus clarus TaxID=94130 RepID=A0A8H3KP60_9GLOM|nr:hypothetical protein RCL_jg2315.t1 [Rhizophagus clarus]